jgi:hypothetical protein
MAKKGFAKKTTAKKVAGKKPGAAKRVRAPRRARRSRNDAQEKGRYVASLSLNGDTRSGNGDTPLEAINNLAAQVTPTTIKTRILLRLSLPDIGLAAEKVIYSMQLKRFSASRISREVYAKQLEKALR